MTHFPRWNREPGASDSTRGVSVAGQPWVLLSELFGVMFQSYLA
jgi:hypothetical protein